MSRRAFFQVLWAVAAIAVILLSAGGLFAQGRSDEAFEHVKAVQERHTESLLARPGVVGTAIGLDDNGRHVILILLEKEGVPDIPADLDGVPVRRRVTGAIYALPKGGKPPGSDVVPNPPSDLVAIADGTRIDLTWTDNSKNERGFRIERRDGEGEFVEIATTRKNATSYSDTGLDRSIEYTYRTCAFNDAGNSDYSNEASVSAEGSADTEPPAAPTNLSAAAVGSDQINLTWTASTSSDVASYSVYRSETSGSPYTQIKSGITGTQYSDTGLAASTTYYYVATAVDTAGNESGNSNQASATTDAAPVPTDPADRFPRPVPIGVSTGHPSITAGTISCRVTDGSAVYALSNNHVYAASNEANIGDAVIQPGTYDGGTSPADDIGTLYDFEPLKFDGSNNTIDAAIALCSTETLGNSTPAGGYGTPSSSPVDPILLLDVKKYGRTTGETTGAIVGVNSTVDVGYGGGRTARFVGQFLVYPGSTFSAGGDSGSLIVTLDGDRPVGLLFAGSVLYTVANPIQSVLDRFNVTVDGK